MHDPQKPLTVEDIMRTHAQFGLLNRDLVQSAMGPNWPKEWDEIAHGEGIFASRDELHRRWQARP